MNQGDLNACRAWGTLSAAHRPPRPVWMPGAGASITRPAGPAFRPGLHIAM